MRPEEAAYEAEFTGETQAAAGLVDVEALTSVLSCVGCDLGCSLPLTSCRKAWRDIVKYHQKAKAKRRHFRLILGKIKQFLGKSF